uniref:Uncharacterized protein MANES_03G134500 n=1 Tax=Rhizophora mucronata TaxID=61149 RepID=A0A2P2L730_RHIMU
MPQRENGCVLEEPRQAVKKFLARPQHEGLGAIVRRSIGRYAKKQTWSKLMSPVFFPWRI